MEQALRWLKKYRFQILILSVYLVFHKKVQELLSDYLVDRVLASVEPSIELNIFFYSISFGFLAYVFYLWWNQIIVSNSFLGWLSLLAISYTLERKWFTHFTFTTLHKDGTLAYTDIIILVAISFLIYKLIKPSKFESCISWISGVKSFSKNKEEQIGFETDYPEAIKSNDEDIYSRLPYVNALRGRILATDCTKTSLAIGVIGNWGAGKTVFLKTLELQLQEVPDIIQIWFNPWMAGSPEKIVEIFFSDLSNELNKYDRNLKDVIGDYSNELIKSIDASSFKLSSLFLESGAKGSLTDQYEKINTTIKRLSKKLIVYIDDLDRLDKNEILEVLRLVRNTASFSNIFFVVAFDRSYLVESINSVLGSKREAYIEKIFQVEYTLPVPRNKNISESLVYKRLSKILNPEEKMGLLYFREDDEKQQKMFEAEPLFNEYLKNLRDVKRYLNHFETHFDLVRGYVYLPDLLNIKILQLKYPSVYEELYKNPNKFLVSSRDNQTSDTSLIYTLRQVTDGNNANKALVVEEELIDKGEKYSLNEDSAQSAISLLIELFGKPKLWNRSASRNLALHHRSIIYVDHFDKYFENYDDGKIDQREFERKLNEGDEAFLSFIDAMIPLEREADSELKDSLENYQPSTQQQFETLVKGIFHYSTSKAIREAHPSKQISFKKLENIIGGRYTTSSNKVYTKLYSSGTDSYRSFLLKALDSLNGADANSFIYQFYRWISWDYYDVGEVSLTFTIDYIKEWFIKRLESVINNSFKTTPDIVSGLQEIVDYHKIDNDPKYKYSIIVDPQLNSIITNFKTKLLNTNIETFIFNNIVRCKDFNDGPGFRLHQAFIKVMSTKQDVENLVADTSFSNDFKNDFLRLYDSAIDEKILPCQSLESFPNLRPVRKL